VSCSFAGGCDFTVTSPGLASVIKAHSTQNYIDVCSIKSDLDTAQSTSGQVSCKLPSLSTVYSNENFGIATVGVINSGKYFGTGSNPENAFDGDWLNVNSDSSSDCNLGMEFKEGFVGLLNQVKYFLGEGDHASLSGNLIFQGSNDGVTYTDIFTADDLVHEGWNYVEFGTDKDITTQPNYRFYRFKGTVSNAC
jgi:hypothetical protein